MLCLVGFLQGGIEDTEVFYILQMACDYNCTAEGSCWDLLIGSSVLRDHPTLCVGAACWLRLVCVVPLLCDMFPFKPASIWKSLPHSDLQSVEPRFHLQLFSYYHRFTLLQHITAFIHPFVSIA